MTYPLDVLVEGKLRLFLVLLGQELAAAVIYVQEPEEPHQVVADVYLLFVMGADSGHERPSAEKKRRLLVPQTSMGIFKTHSLSLSKKKE